MHRVRNGWDPPDSSFALCVGGTAVNTNDMAAAMAELPPGSPVSAPQHSTDAPLYHRYIGWLIFPGRMSKLSFACSVFADKRVSFGTCRDFFVRGAGLGLLGLVLLLFYFADHDRIGGLYTG